MSAAEVNAEVVRATAVIRGAQIAIRQALDYMSEARSIVINLQTQKLDAANYSAGLVEDRLDQALSLTFSTVYELENYRA